ncbi:unnamed protein product [Phytophthora lilii]|uniref:Unnamed protein product n=1 Tax=Phytophthora lilii TaxID=2077276 RepID=A0A9W6UC46_9STRA|nr:unnamed protein product [Phytophthora lilii]
MEKRTPPVDDQREAEETKRARIDVDQDEGSGTDEEVDQEMDSSDDASGDEEEDIGETHAIEWLDVEREEAVTEAARTVRVEWLDNLLDEYVCDVSEAAVSAAAANGQIEALKVLLPEVEGDYDGEVSDAIAVAAGNGHLDVVRILLPEISAGWKRNDTAWEVMEEAAAHGHCEVVAFAVQNAKVYLEDEDTISPAGKVAVR